MRNFSRVISLFYTNNSNVSEFHNTAACAGAWSGLSTSQKHDMVIRSVMASKSLHTRNGVQK